MNIGVVGNREGWNRTTVLKRLQEHIEPEDHIISGGAIGVDAFAQQYAMLMGNTITIHYPNPRIIPSKRYFIRNRKIALDCDILIAFDNKKFGSGTKNTISQARKLGKKIIIITTDD